MKEGRGSRRGLAGRQRVEAANGLGWARKWGGFCRGGSGLVGFSGLVVRREGFLLTTLIQSPAPALWSGTYGAAQDLGYKDDAKKKTSLLVEMVFVEASAGMVAGAVYSVITTPLDTVKTRLQVMDNYGDGRPSVTKTCKTLLKQDGKWGFCRRFEPVFLHL
ncbi:hypothetical protein BVRB_3g057090 isoform B [Beta vulgaris subsp. vulgaris]|nr:hypothetical protein BVRB_3g057090 isoform B [Beta vulgaris subsp. vulgaris]